VLQRLRQEVHYGQISVDVTVITCCSIAQRSDATRSDYCPSARGMGAALLDASAVTVPHWSEMQREGPLS
jgi:hypothetical protein